MSPERHTATRTMWLERQKAFSKGGIHSKRNQCDCSGSQPTCGHDFVLLLAIPQFSTTIFVELRVANNGDRVGRISLGFVRATPRGPRSLRRHCGRMICMVLVVVVNAVTIASVAMINSSVTRVVGIFRYNACGSNCVRRSRID